MSNGVPQRGLRIALPIVAALFIGGLIGAWVADSNQPLGGVGNADGSLGGEFTLEGLYGPVSLSDYRGKVVVIYFGFLGCTNYCDTSMAVLKAAFDRLPYQQVNELQAFMISIDPWRDDIRSLDAYTRSWHPKIAGLIGTQQEIAKLTRRYGAWYERTESEDGGDYEYLHTSRFFIIDRDGELVDAMRHSTTPNELAARLKQYTGAQVDQG